MQVTVADAGTLRKSITLTWTAAEVAARTSQLVTRIAGEVKVNGFRPGKANKAILERRYGAAARQQAEEDLSQEGFKQAIGEHKIKPFGQAKTESIKRDDGLVIALTLEVFPQVALPEASAFQIANEAVVVADKDIDDTIQSIARRAGATTPLEAAETVQEDDAVTLTGTISVAGAEVRKLHDFHHLVGGYPLFGKEPKDVIASFAGKKVGDTVTLTTVLPKSFSPAEHAGKDAELSVAVASAQRTRAKPVDDELAKGVGVESVAKLREVIGERFKQRKESEQRQGQVDALQVQLLEKVQVELPPLAFAQSVAGARADAEVQAKDDAEKKAKADEAAANVEKSLKRMIVLDALADKMQVQVAEQDFQEQIHLAAQQTGRKAQDIADHLVKSGRVNQVAMEIREAKALEALLDQIVGAKTTAAKA